MNFPAQPGYTEYACCHVFTVCSGQDGVARFRIKGNYTAPVNAFPFSRTCEVYTCWQGPCVGCPNNRKFIGNAKIAAPDLNSDAGVTSSDLSILLHDQFAGPAGYCTRSDLNGDGFVNGSDNSLLLSVRFDSCPK